MINMGEFISIIMRKYQLLLVLAILITASLACNLPGARRPKDTQPEPIAVTTEAAGQLEDNVEDAAGAVLGGAPFTLTIDEAQATSAVSLRLQSIQEPSVKDLQIYLRDGQIQVFGDVERDGLSLPVSFAARVIASQGSLAYEILDARVGPFPLPESFVDELEAQLDQFILNQLSPNMRDIVIEDITIAGGVMTITGHAR